MKSRDIIFLVVISSDKGASNAIRNSQILLKLKENNDDILEIDFGYIFNAKGKVRKIFLLTLLIINSIFIILWNPKSKLIISTNPKWILFLPIIMKRNFDLYLGDPFIGDVSKVDNFVNTFLWKRSLKLIKKLIVFSPFLY